MNALKLRMLLLIPVLLAGILFFAGHLVDTKNGDIQGQCRESLQKNQAALLSLIEEYQGQWLEKESRGVSSFSVYLGEGLAYADLRNPREIIFSFSSAHPERAQRLIYCPEDRLFVRGDEFLEPGEEAIHLENLGMDGKGSIRCLRLMAGWFYYEAYLPT